MEGRGRESERWLERVVDVTQVFTRGKQVQIPAESVLDFSLERTLVLRLAP